jgi:hypothetical protein
VRQVTLILCVLWLVGVTQVTHPDKMNHKFPWQHFSRGMLLQPCIKSLSVVSKHLYVLKSKLVCYEVAVAYSL